MADNNKKTSFDLDKEKLYKELDNLSSKVKEIDKQVDYDIKALSNLRREILSTGNIFRSINNKNTIITKNTNILEKSLNKVNGINNKINQNINIKKNEFNNLEKSQKLLNIKQLEEIKNKGNYAREKIRKNQGINEKQLLENVMKASNSVFNSVTQAVTNSVKESKPSRPIKYESKVDYDNWKMGTDRTHELYKGPFIDTIGLTGGYAGALENSATLFKEIVDLSSTKSISAQSIDRLKSLDSSVKDLEIKGDKNNLSLTDLVNKTGNYLTEGIKQTNPGLTALGRNVAKEVLGNDYAKAAAIGPAAISEIMKGKGTRSVIEFGKNAKNGFLPSPQGYVVDLINAKIGHNLNTFYEIGNKKQHTYIKNQETVEIAFNNLEKFKKDLPFLEKDLQRLLELRKNKDKTDAEKNEQIILQRNLLRYGKDATGIDGKRLTKIDESSVLSKIVFSDYKFAGKLKDGFEGSIKNLFAETSDDTAVTKAFKNSATKTITNVFHPFKAVGGLVKNVMNTPFNYVNSAASILDKAINKLTEPKEGDSNFISNMKKATSGVSSVLLHPIDTVKKLGREIELRLPLVTGSYLNDLGKRMDVANNLGIKLQRDNADYIFEFYNKSSKKQGMRLTGEYQSNQTKFQYSAATEIPSIFKNIFEDNLKSSLKTIENARNESSKDRDRPSSGLVDINTSKLNAISHDTYIKEIDKLDQQQQAYKINLHELDMKSKEIGTGLFGNIKNEKTYKNTNKGVKDQFSQLENQVYFLNPAKDQKSESVDKYESTLNKILEAAIKNDDFDIKELNTKLDKLNDDHVKTKDTQKYSDEIDKLAKEYAKKTNTTEKELRQILYKPDKDDVLRGDPLDQILKSYGRDRVNLANGEAFSLAIEKQYNSVHEVLRNSVVTDNSKKNKNILDYIKNSKDNGLPEEVKNMIKSLENGKNSTEVLKITNKVLMSINAGEINAKDIQNKIDEKIGKNIYTVDAELLLNKDGLELDAKAVLVDYAKGRLGVTEIPVGLKAVIESDPNATGEQVDKLLGLNNRFSESIESIVAKDGSEKGGKKAAKLLNDYDKADTQFKNVVDKDKSIGLEEAVNMKKVYNDFPKEVKTFFVTEGNHEALKNAKNVFDAIDKVPKEKKSKIETEMKKSKDGQKILEISKNKNLSKDDKVKELEKYNKSKIKPKKAEVNTKKASKNVSNLSKSLKKIKNKTVEIKTKFTNIFKNKTTKKKTTNKKKNVKSSSRAGFNILNNQETNNTMQRAIANYGALASYGAEDTYIPTTSTGFTLFSDAERDGATIGNKLGKGLLGAFKNKIANDGDSLAGYFKFDIDFTREIDAEMSRVSNDISLIDKKMVYASDDEKLKYLEEQNKLYAEQKALVEEKIKNEGHLDRQRNWLKENLKNSGFQFDENGKMTNYEEYLLERAKKLQSLEDKANKKNVKQKDIDAYNKEAKKFEELQKMAEQYFQVEYDNIPKLKEEWQELQNQIIAKENQVKEIQAARWKVSWDANWVSADKHVTEVNNEIAMVDVLLENAVGEEKGILIKRKIELLFDRKKEMGDTDKLLDDALNKAKDDAKKYEFEFENGNIVNYRGILDSYKENKSSEEFEKAKKAADEYLDLYINRIPEAKRNQAELNNQIKNAYKQQLEITKSVEDEITKIYEKEVEERKKLIDKELKTNVDALKKKKEAYNDERKESNYQKNYAKQFEEVNKIQKQLDIAQRDTSLSGQKKVKDLLEKLKEEQEKLQDIVQDKIDDDVNQRYDKEIERLEEEAEKEKVNLDEKYSKENIQNWVNEALNTGMFTDIDGKVTNLKDKMIEFTDKWGEGLGATGEIIKGELISNLEIARDIMKDIMEEDSKILNEIGKTNDYFYESIMSPEMKNIYDNLKEAGNKLDNILKVEYNAPVVNIEGNVDNDILPEIEKMVKRSQNQLANEIFRQTGY
ncbi:hypothetical protein [Metaclostridioides mangenotii]|uniref:hypothetical protein n=1 Tax=Metaclostridioides mangenotii TaxID=1540 RepID=UPI0004845BD3|nr:hypothetical protein [Clostridioides mangenotii]